MDDGTMNLIGRHDAMRREADSLRAELARVYAELKQTRILLDEARAALEYERRQRAKAEGDVVKWESRARELESLCADRL